MSTTDQHLESPEGTLGDKDPVLVLLSEISANLKELNSTLKNHTVRLARLEETQSGDKSSQKDKISQESSWEDDKITGLHNSEGGSIQKGRIEIRPEGNTKTRDISAITPRAESSHLFKVLKTIKVKPGELPIREVFDELDGFDISWSRYFELGYDKEFLSWLKEKQLAFAFDGRQSIPFDFLTLSHHSSLKWAQEKLHSMEKFLRELEGNGGLFLIREKSGVLGALICTFDPVKSRPITYIPISEPPTIYEKIAGSSGNPSLPNGWRVRAPFRRLCVFGGVFRMPSVHTEYSGGRGVLQHNIGGFATDLKYNIMLTQFAQFAVRPETDLSRSLSRWPLNESVMVHELVPETGYSLKFQFVWYEIVKSSDYELRRSSGNLYRDLNERKLQEQSCLVAAVWNRNFDLEMDNDEWTINLMLPASLYGKAESSYRIRTAERIQGTYILNQRPAVFMEPLESVLPMLTKILFEVISKILRDWASISEYIEPFVGSKLTFLHEEKHDSLLFDDDTFSRSRQYSWVITSIDEFIPIILKTKKTYSDVIQCVISSREEKDSAWAKGVKYGEQLRAIEETLQNQKARAETLRDGLFNASAVVESRLSTRLAQNVKLLTYVSIFYLPLSFCAALWAIPNITDSSTRTPFIIAAVLIGFMTYMIVFNLNALVAFGWATYDTVRERCIQKMNEHSENKTWEKLGRRFKRFEPDRGSDKPSEWYILLYCILHPTGLLKRINSPTTPLERESKKAAEVPRSQGWKRWFQLPSKKPKRDDRKGKGIEDTVPCSNPPEPV